MLQGALLYQEDPGQQLLTSLTSIPEVKWGVVDALRLRKKVNRSAITQDYLIDTSPFFCDLAVILDPAMTAFPILSDFVRMGCHLFLTEQISMSSSERSRLIQLAEEGNTHLQIRNDFLYKSILQKEESTNRRLKLIEIHQTMPSKAGQLKEMIFNNLLITIRLAGDEVNKISVFSIPNSGHQPEVVNLQLTFNNGSAANITLSYVGNKSEHLLTVHKENCIENYNLRKNLVPDKTDKIAGSQINELLFKQITDFVNGIINQQHPRFSLRDELKVYHILERINRKLHYNSLMI